MRAVLLLLLFGSCSALGCGESNLPGGAETTSTDELRRRAISGDSESALQLFNLHLSDCRNEVEDGMFWLRVAAEQGNCDGMLELARATRSSPLGPSVSEYWASRAAASACPAHSRWDPRGVKRE